ncbi:MAG: hypothetical protein IJ157_08230 [Clostridia bacterium]|nr:hypothetical protein [Clostridia bacterium]
MKNTTAKKAVSIVVLAALCVATLAGLYLGVFGRNTEYVTIHTDSGDEQQALYRQVAFIPNTLNTTWQEAIRPEAKLGGGYAYTYTFDSADAGALKAAAKVMGQRAQSLAGNANTKVENGAVTVSVPETAYNATLAAVLAPMGDFDFVLYNTSDGTMGEPVLTAEQVKQTYLSTSSSTYQVQVQFNSKGVKAYNDLRAQTSGAMLYLRLDGQPAAYASLSALNNDMLSFTVSDSATAYLLVTCMRSGVLPGNATLADSQAAQAESGAVNILIIGCAVLALLTCLCLVFIARAGGLAGAWAVLAWIVCFFLLASLISVGVNWVMTSLSMTAIVICFIAFLYGLVTLFGEMAGQTKRGRGAYAACVDASGKKIKFLSILYGAVLLVGVVLMVAFRAAAYGVLGRIIAVSALVSFVMVLVFPRLVLGCMAALTGKK